MHRHLKLDKVATQHADGSVTYQAAALIWNTTLAVMLEQMHGGGPRD